ncbi:MAG: NUDIX hydrolase [Candidatus Saccharimonadota bacterium]|jgi:8-oxo-dGTP diphosphatase
MIKVAKVLIKNSEGRYLVLVRNDHPVFGYDLDLPGGTIEKGEEHAEAALREVFEETGIMLKGTDIHHVETTTRYSRLRNEYTLYKAQVATTPAVTLSWEHSEHQWLSEQDFTQKAQKSKDRFMHFAADKGVSNTPEEQ